MGWEAERRGVSSSLFPGHLRWPAASSPASSHPAIHLDISPPCCPSAAPPEATCDVLGVDISGRDARPCFRSSPPLTLVLRQLGEVTGCEAAHDHRRHLRPPTAGMRERGRAPLRVRYKRVTLSTHTPVSTGEARSGRRAGGRAGAAVVAESSTCALQGGIVGRLGKMHRNLYYFSPLHLNL